MQTRNQRYVEKRYVPFHNQTLHKTELLNDVIAKTVHHSYYKKANRMLITGVAMNTYISIQKKINGEILKECRPQGLDLTKCIIISNSLRYTDTIIISNFGA